MRAPAAPSPARTLIVDLPGPELTPALGRWLRALNPGGVCLFARNMPTPGATARLVADIRDALERDALIATDQEGGAVLRRLDSPQPPTPQGLGVLGDEGAAFEAGALAARGLLELGINWNYAPSLDVNVDPLNPVIGERSFGADPALVARLGVAWARGSEAAGVLSSVKHYPGHGDTRVDSHLALPVVGKTRAELEACEWVPFRAAVQAGVGSVMTAHILYPALDPERPATLSPTLLGGVLRGEWGYDGVIVTDAMDMKAVADRYPGGRGAALALAAGADAVLVCGHGDQTLHDLHAAALDTALLDGTLDPARVDEAVARLAQAAARFPGSPRPYSPAQRDQDEAATARWARGALEHRGAVPTLDPAAPALLFAPETGELGGPYGDHLGLNALAEALRPVLPGLHAAPVEDAAAVQALLARFAGAPALLATTDRWAIPGATRALAARLAARPAPAVHLALWAPDAAAQLPLPALVTHGFRRAHLQAAAQVLTGVPAP
ncbi:glycoside hydrolase family 3 N-terminal domain-containing protein [Deinococcus arcticus]|uniref:Glycoside hydrolase n=1 Tax=Deinococcus arcticus TaxID=2136176 RepID=A0A2T3W3D7_9DEIO|nr:glycoside hydrolase family 3 N-terminal domain-containing protein [Deinococcus arcticus]PTA66349.1 glycoside hydrolase [Deinococcus arcticus]